MSCRLYILGGKGDVTFFSVQMKKPFEISCLYLWAMSCTYDPPSPVVVIKFKFCAHSARLLKKIDHVLL